MIEQRARREVGDVRVQLAGVRALRRRPAESTMASREKFRITAPRRIALDARGVDELVGIFG